jgi:hypothetical protein
MLGLSYLAIFSAIETPDTAMAAAIDTSISIFHDVSISADIDTPAHLTYTFPGLLTHPYQEMPAQSLPQLLT